MHSHSSFSRDKGNLLAPICLITLSFSIRLSLEGKGSPAPEQSLSQGMYCALYNVSCPVCHLRPLPCPLSLLDTHFLPGFQWVSSSLS